MSEPVVHLIDDDDDARQALAFLLESNDFQVVAYESAPAFLAALPGASPGYVVSDIRMPEMTGLELAQRLHAINSGFPVIIITGHGDVPMAVEAMRAGVVDFLEKPFSNERILEALDRAAKSPNNHPAVPDGSHTEIMARLETLSERERQVLDRVIAGAPNKIIARDLGISPRTVEIYRAKLMTKMQADNLASLVRMALMVEAGPAKAGSV
ncbi:MAG TPA: response regulator FixJ [Caulobacteraceae bacterium]|nr:response regulator FixJ [Caulobacteraceae bacterium]